VVTRTLLSGVTVALVLTVSACPQAESSDGGLDVADATSQSADAASDAGQPPTDAAVGDDATRVPGDPIVATAETWTWVDFPDAVCGNGLATGLGVNLTQRSSDALIYLNGGGACWDANTCFTLGTASHVEHGYTGQTFENEPVRNAAAFDREDTANPFRDLSYALIPYCTGDLHAGDQVRNYQVLGQWREVHYQGAPNLEAYLARLAPTFASADRIFIAGSSAGGYGVQLNYHRFARAFPWAEVHLLADCAQMVQPWGGRLATWNAAWELQTPEGCEGCATDFPAWLDHTLDSAPDRRFALLAYDEDQTVTIYFNYPLDGTFKTAFDRLLVEQYDGRDNANYFVLPGTTHVMLGGLTSLSTAGGQDLTGWIAQWLAGESGWASAR